MRNPKLVPYETIVRATSGEPEVAPFPHTDFSGIGNQITPTPGTERRYRHLSHPFGIRRTLLPCRQSGAGIYKGANF